MDAARQVELIKELKDSSTPEVLFDSFSAADKALVREYLTPVTFEEQMVSNPDMSAQAAGCFANTYSSTARNALNMRLFMVYHVVNWCSNGSIITSISKNKGYDIYAPLTRFNRYSEDFISGKGTAQAYAVTAASFTSGTYGIDLMEQVRRVTSYHNR